jgi:hypothetical protein
MKSGQDTPFDPLDKRHLGESIAQALLRQLASPITSLAPFEGAGIYALYYDGSFSGYEAISQQNQEGYFTSPIYMGKAVPKGARKGSYLEASAGKVLYRRLMQHKRSLEEAVNLDINNFYCRYLVVDEIWIPLGESLLITRFNPLWNVVIDGFGNHDPGRGRHGGLRSRWDVLHPGRSWAERCQPRKETAELIMDEVMHHLRNHPTTWHNNSPGK